jgi:hypothetical protein
MTVLRIEGDPATWVLGANSPAEVLQQDLISQSGPVTVEVVSPLVGRLVLSTQSVAHVALLTPGAGWIPGGAIQPRALLYVPSPAGPTLDSPGYTLPASLDLAALEIDILAAMTDGTTIAVEVSDGIFSGPLLLNGAVLPFAVICPAV